MAIEALNNYNNKTCVVPMAKGALVGAAIGWAMKYGYPLNEDEKSTREYLHAQDSINKTKESYNPWTRSYIDEIKARKTRSLAEDVFVSTYDNMKSGEKVGKTRLLNAFHKLQAEKPELVPELRRLFEDVRYQAGKMAKKAMSSYNIATKHFRPTEFFITTGAITGATVALLHSVLKTNVKD